jgi:anti-anti-sigma factor
MDRLQVGGVAAGRRVTPAGGSVASRLEGTPSERASNRVEITFPTVGLAHLELVGDHDLATHALLREALANATTRRRDVLVDLSRCSFLDSTSVAALARAQEEVTSDGGRFALVIAMDVGPVTRRTSEIMRLAEFFPVDSAAAAALTGSEHPCRVRDLRARFSDRESYAAECSCGWQGATRDATSTSPERR